LISSADVGTRVVVRLVVGQGPTGRTVFTDITGELLALDAARLVVRTDDGRSHTHPFTEVHAAKRIPPRRPRFSEIAAVEWAAASTWPAPTRERLGDWLLRAADGWTARGNSALPLGDPGMPLPAAIDRVTDWYAALHLRPAVSLPLPVCRGVHEEVLSRGWDPWPTTLVQTAPLDILRATAPARDDLPPVALSDRPSPAWLATVAGRKGTLPASAYRLLTEAPQVRFAEVYPDEPAGDRLAALGRGAVSADGQWLVLSLIEVTPDHRRRGLARHVARALADWAAQLGARRAALQVLEENTAALNLYGQLGFTTHHAYVTLTAPTGPA
jgi:GNAT superfamily N-acetyltransferase